MSADPGEEGRQQLQLHVDRSGMTYRELWLRQISIGGDADGIELEAYVLGLLRLDPHQHDLIAQALNEHFLERGEDHPTPYSQLWDRGPLAD